MSLYDGLAENSRRNERVDRGIVTVPTGTGAATIVLGPTANGSATLVLNSTHGNMRKMTHFELTVDDNGTRLAASNTAPVVISGNINSANQTVGSIVYPAGTVLNVNSYAIGATGLLGAPTGTLNVRFTVWGNLSGAAGF